MMDGVNTRIRKAKKFPIGSFIYVQEEHFRGQGKVIGHHSKFTAIVRWTSGTTTAVSTGILKKRTRPHL